MPEEIKVLVSEECGACRKVVRAHAAGKLPPEARLVRLEQDSEEAWDLIRTFGLTRVPAAVREDTVCIIETAGDEVLINCGD